MGQDPHHLEAGVWGNEYSPIQ